MKSAILGIAILILTSGVFAQRNDNAQAADPIAEWSDIQKLLVNQSISPEWRDCRGYSAAYYHLIYGSEQRAEQLILESRRIGIWIEGEHDRLLEIAIRQNSQRVVAALIKHGDSVSVDRFGFSPMQLAAALGRLEIVRMLLQAGADPFCKGCLGQSPVEMALTYGHWRVVLLMRDSGVNIQNYLRDKNQWQLVFRAIDGKSLEGLIMLDKLGFSLIQQNIDGLTPFEYALLTNAPDQIIDFFFMREKNFCAKNKKGNRMLNVISKIPDYETPPLNYWLNLIKSQISMCR
ncbi:ankyrin repeat domain-containing protein [Massilia sp. YIM B04103]|uniref:ankyrin repeat domain-containing protein n=1 Tax=Massilia sp. YIM B04103 TaxID=2963106 RepID=UPI0021094BBA|nr:ankyrin repeat domain-containing protein [Massilia sp. YIM B04103]